MINCKKPIKIEISGGAFFRCDAFLVLESVGRQR